MVLLLFTHVLPLACRRTLLQALGKRTPLYFTRVCLIQKVHVEYTDRLSVQVYHQLYLGPRRSKSGCDFALNAFGCIIRALYILNSVHNALDELSLYPVYIACLVLQTGVIFTHYLKFLMHPLSVF